MRPAASLWPEVNAALRSTVLAENAGYTLADLWETSPVRLPEGESQAEAVVDTLFPGDPLLCCGRSSAVFATRPRSAWRGRLAGLALMVPSAMTSRTGLTQDGRESEHTLANTGPRQHLIIEQDGGAPDEQAAILAHLALFAPLVLVVHSGRRSLHGVSLRRAARGRHARLHALRREPRRGSRHLDALAVCPHPRRPPRQRETVNTSITSTRPPASSPKTEPLKTHQLVPPP